MTGALTPGERFWSKVDKLDDGCWTWNGSILPDGYGKFFTGESRRPGETSHSAPRMVLAHRWSYEQSHGPIPAGLQIDHLCYNRACVNPAHLEAVSGEENVRRAAANAGLNLRCRNGHLRTESNTVLRSNGWRECGTCKAERNRLRYVEAGR